MEENQLVSQGMNALNQVVELVSRFGLRFLGSLAILMIGAWVVRLIKKPLRRLLGNSKLDSTIVEFLVSVAGYALLAFVVVAAFNNLGVATGSFVAVLGAAGLAFGLAMEGSLANFAAGVMLAVFRPFSLGDFIEAADTEGVVENITIVHATVVTLDNETVIIPNSELTSGKIVNYSTKPYSRIEIPLILDHDADFAAAYQLLERVPSGCRRILAEPPAEVQVTRLTAEGIEMQLEVSVEAIDREDAGFEVAEAIERHFDEAGIRPPRRHLDVRMNGAATG